MSLNFDITEVRRNGILKQVTVKARDGADEPVVIDRVYTHEGRNPTAKIEITLPELTRSLDQWSLGAYRVILEEVARQANLMAAENVR